MSDDKTLKDQLPFPYNQDLSKVLTHLNRVTSFHRDKLANDPVTAAYLAAAMRLVGYHLGPDPVREPADPRDEDSLDRKLFSFISQRAVSDEVANNPDPFPRQGSLGTIRSTWRSQSHFIADLISFAMWLWNHPANFDDEVLVGAERLLEGPDPVDAVHQLAYLNMADNISTAAYRLTYVAMAAADGDKTLSDTISQVYDVLLTPWKEIYAAFGTARGLKLRPGITIDDIANILAAVVDGLQLRTIGNPSPALVDHDRKKTVLGTAALALAYSFFEPAGNASGQTLEQAVHEMICGPQDPQESPA